MLRPAVEVTAVPRLEAQQDKIIVHKASKKVLTRKQLM